MDTNYLTQKGNKMYTVTVETQSDDYKRRGGNSWTFVARDRDHAMLIATREILERLENSDFDDLDGYESYFLSRDPRKVWEWYKFAVMDERFAGEYVPWTFRVEISEKNEDFEEVNMKEVNRMFDEFADRYEYDEEDE